MSLYSNKAGKEIIKKNNTFEYFSTSSFYDDKNYDLNTVSTLEKGRLAKAKKVMFKGVEIIEVESFKKYNEIPLLTFESLESNCMKSYEACNCNIF